MTEVFLLHKLFTDFPKPVFSASTLKPPVQLKRFGSELTCVNVGLQFFIRGTAPCKCTEPKVTEKQTSSRKDPADGGAASGEDVVGLLLHQHGHVLHVPAPRVQALLHAFDLKGDGSEPDLRLTAARRRTSCFRRFAL